LQRCGCNTGSGPAPAFDAEVHIHIIHEDQQALEDVTDAAHHVGTADTVLETLRPFVLDADWAIHASIAGGRKSMSFYMGCRCLRASKTACRTSWSTRLSRACLHSASRRAWLRN
jgi:CRISPR-associated protein (TIGR02584 family)